MTGTVGDTESNSARNTELAALHLPSKLALQNSPSLSSRYLRSEEKDGPIIGVLTTQLDLQSFSSVNYLQTTSVPLINCIGTMDIVSREILGTPPVFFSMWPSMSTEVTALLDVMVSFGWKTLAPVFSTSEYGLSGGSAMYDEASKRGIQLVCQEVIGTDAVRNVQRFAKCVSQYEINTVALFMDQTRCIAALNELQKYPYNDNNTIAFLSDRCTFCTSNANGTSIQSEDGSYSRQVMIPTYPRSFLTGFFGFFPYAGNLAPIANCIGSTEQSLLRKTRYKNIFDVLKCDPRPNDLEICPKSIVERTKSCKCTSLEKLPTSNFETLRTLDPALNYVWDSVLTIATALDYILNKCSMLKGRDFCSGDYFTSSMIVDAIGQIQVKGRTGIIDFSSGKPYRNWLNFTVLQYDDTTTHAVGEWDNILGVTMDRTDLSFKNNSIPYANQPETTQFDNQKTAPLLFFILSIVGCTLCGVLAAFFTFAHFVVPKITEEAVLITSPE